MVKEGAWTMRARSEERQAQASPLTLGAVQAGESPPRSNTRPCHRSRGRCSGGAALLAAVLRREVLMALADATHACAMTATQFSGQAG